MNVRVPREGLKWALMIDGSQNDTLMNRKYA